MKSKPYHVFTVEGQAYLVKLLSNRVYAISPEESDAFRLFTEKHTIDPALLQKYALCSAEDAGAYEAKRAARWRNLFAEKKVYCLELMVAQECNMRCDYCYGDVHFGGSGLMSWATAKQALDWLLEAMEGKTYPPKSEVLVSFFGGEPLLNFPVIQKSVEYLWDIRKQRNILFSITTNLSLLTQDMLDFMLRYPMGLCISYDGRMQRKYRRFAQGGDSHDIVTANIQKVLAVMPDASGRATLYGEANMDDMADDLRRCGFRRGYINAASGSLIRGRVLASKRDLYRMQMETYPALTRRYLAAIKTRDEATYRRISFDSEFMQAVGFGWNPPVNMMSCGCGRTLYTVDTQGDVYPCHRFVGVPEMKLGNLSQAELSLDTDAFSSHITLEHPECRVCFLRFTCGGSCMHENYCDASAGQGAPSIHVPFDTFCAYRRTAAELAIHVMQSLDAQDKAWLREMEHGKRQST